MRTLCARVSKRRFGRGEAFFGEGHQCRGLFIVASGRIRELADIAKLFAEVGREMIMRMQKEEQILSSYIDALGRAVHAHVSVEPPFFQTAAA
jgi:hypothetical protein